MKTFDPLTDELIQAAFERRARRADPGGLREDILTRTATTRQGPVWRLRLSDVVSTPALRPASIALLVVIAIVVAALGVALVGQHPRTPLRNGSWTRAATMLHARAEFTATLLGNGKVLAAGGLTGVGTQGLDQAIGSCELYDPSADTWTATGPLIQARAYFVATRLLDGTVLVAGGSDQTNVSLDSAELYDPRTGTWSSVGRMVQARIGATAVLLADGRVLVLGGYGNNPNVPLGSVELYDPGSRSWTATANMLEARTGFSAAVLPNGRVLVTGGAASRSEQATSTAEFYDPGNGSWTNVEPMIEARVAATATVLGDGEVLVAGGHRGSGLHSDSLTSAELYDPSSGSWRATGDMLDPDAYLTSTRLSDDEVLVTGGYENDTGNPHDPELYDPVSGSWRFAGTKLAPATKPVATLLLNGTVLVAGGTITGSPLDATEVYDPTAGT